MKTSDQLPNSELPIDSELPMKSELPTESVMMQAFLQGDASFDGIFITAVRTTGIFCRVTCTAKKPRPENVQFYGTPIEALLSGYRPCKRCRPLEAAGEAPAWLRPLLADLEQEPTRRWRDGDLRTVRGAGRYVNRPCWPRYWDAQKERNRLAEPSRVERA